MKRILLLIPVLLALLLAACDNTSEPRFDGDVYTVAGLIYAGLPVSVEHPIYVTRSSEIEDFNPAGIFVADAVVSIRDLDTGQVINLEPTLHEFKVKYQDPLAAPIQANHRYRIEVTVPGYDKLIWAETTVPPAVNLLTDPYGNNPAGTGYSLDPNTANTTPFTAIDSQYPIVLDTGNAAGNYNFFGETWCLEEFSTDLEFTTPALGITNVTENLRDVYNAGGAFRRVQFLYRFESGPHPGIAGNSLVFGDYGFAFVLYGRYRVSAYLVDDNFYSYTYRDEGYLNGGVNNALGYFGSASGGEMYIEIVK